MKQPGLWLVALLTLALAATRLRADSTLDALQRDLETFRVQNDQAKGQVLRNFLGQTMAGSANPDSASTLFEAAMAEQNANDSSSADASVDATHDSLKKHKTAPTPDPNLSGADRHRLREEAETLRASLAPILQIHCGLLRFAALFAFSPNTPNLNTDWINFLKSAGQAYPNLPRTESKPDMLSMQAKDSPISHYLGVPTWPDGEPSTWSVDKLPKLFLKNIVEPFTKNRDTEALPAWDVYIAMEQADDGAMSQWPNVELPKLQFQRAVADFQLAPTAQKLALLIDFIKANPNLPNLDDMIGQVQGLIQQMKGGTPPPSSSQ